MKEGQIRETNYVISDIYSNSFHWLCMCVVYSSKHFRCFIKYSLCPMAVFFNHFFIVACLQGNFLDIFPLIIPQMKLSYHRYSVLSVTCCMHTSAFLHKAKRIFIPKNQLCPFRGNITLTENLCPLISKTFSNIWVFNELSNQGKTDKRDINTVHSYYSWQLCSIKSLPTWIRQCKTSCSKGKERIRCLRASGHNAFINSPVQNPALCVFLFKPTSFNIWHWFINVELKTNSTVTKLIWCLPSTRQAPHRLPALRNTRQLFSGSLGATLNSGISNKSKK